MKLKNHKKGQSNDVTLATTIQQQCIAIYINDIYINSIYIYIYINDIVVAQTDNNLQN